MKNITSTVIGVGILVALLFIGWQMYGNTSSDTNLDITVIEQIKKVAKLQTIEMKVATTLKKNKTKKIGRLKIGRRTTTYFAEGTVTAGINLEKMGIDLDKEKNLVTITLPENAVEVSNPTHDNFAISCSHWEKGFVAKFTDGERTKHANEAFANIKTKAEEANIRTKALKQAKAYLSTFVNALGRDIQFN